MKPHEEASRLVMHRMSAEVELCATCEPVDHKSGMFGGEDGWTWNVLPNGNRRVNLQFYANNGVEALNIVHKLMQRHVRGRSDPSNLRRKRATYGPNDYTVIELRHAATGPYDLPGGPNPDLSPKKRESKASNQLEMEGV
jgi:hypothetical protein